MSGEMMEVRVVACDQLTPLLNGMRSILFQAATLSPDDRRDLENLLALLENEMRTGSVKIEI
jgi:hypothetical protein